MAAKHCEAKTRTGGKCQKTAGWGTSHTGAGRCKLHGGSTTNGELHGNLELARRDAVVMGAPLPIDPHEAILQAIHITAGEVQYASARIAELDEAAVMGPVTTTSRGTSKDRGNFAEIHEGAPQLHAWIRIRQQAMDRLVGYSAVAIKSGIEERRVRIAEEVGQKLADVIRGVLKELGVADRPEVPAIVRSHLQLVSGGIG